MLAKHPHDEINSFMLNGCDQGKRKKSSRKPQGPKKVGVTSQPERLTCVVAKDIIQKEPLPTNFPCLFCNHEKSVSVRLDKKAGIGLLSCKVCGQQFTTGINCKLRAQQRWESQDAGLII